MKIKQMALGSVVLASWPSAETRQNALPTEWITVFALPLRRLIDDCCRPCSRLVSQCRRQVRPLNLNALSSTY